MKALYFKGGSMERREAQEFIIKKVAELWAKYPDMRFGQLLANFVYPDEKLNWHEFDEAIAARMKEILKQRGL